MLQNHSITVFIHACKVFRPNIDFRWTSFRWCSNGLLRSTICHRRFDGILIAKWEIKLHQPFILIYGNNCTVFAIPSAQVSPAFFACGNIGFVITSGFAVQHIKFHHNIVSDFYCRWLKTDIWFVILFPVASCGFSKQSFFFCWKKKLRIPVMTNTSTLNGHK